MKKKKISDGIKIITVFIIAFIVSNLLVNGVFINRTPKVRPDIELIFLTKVKDVFNPKAFIAWITGQKQKEKMIAEQKIKEGFTELQKVVFTQIAPGVSVRANENFAEASYDLNGVKWVKHTIEIDGKKVTFGWPEGLELPPDKELEDMLR